MGIHVFAYGCCCNDDKGKQITDNSQQSKENSWTIGREEKFEKRGRRLNTVKRA